MGIEQMQVRAADIDGLYRQTTPPWGLREYAEGMIGDAGDLMKLVMAKEGLREKPNVDAAIEHEVNDLQWSVLMLYRAIGKDPVESFMAAMDELEARISESSDSA